MTDDHVMPPWQAAGSSKPAAITGGGEPTHTGARVVREAQQKADASGKGVQAELIKLLAVLCWRTHERSRDVSSSFSWTAPFFSEFLRGPMGCVRPEMKCNGSSAGPRPGDENRTVVACVVRSRVPGRGASCAPRPRRGKPL